MSSLPIQAGLDAPPTRAACQTTSPSRGACRVIGGVLLGLVLLCTSQPAEASWVRPSQLTFNTAHTLERGVFEVGLLSPLQYGVAEGFQLGIHPLLTLVGVPNLSLRWRPTDPNSDWAVAVNLGIVWSFLPEESAETGEIVDNSFQILSTVTVSWAISRHFLVSVGVGPSVEYDFNDVGVAAEIHGSILWLLDPDQLLMLHAEGYVGISGPDPQRSPVVQLMYARACGATNIGVGLAFGDFALARAFDRKETWVLYPVIDLWWRL